MKWKELIALAREMAATPPSDLLHQTKLRLAVGTVYYAVYHALARSNADLLMGPSKTEGSTPEWDRVDKALGGDTAYDLMQADCSGHPEAVGCFADAFLAVHHQRLLAEEDPATTFTTVEARDGIGRGEIAIAEFRSIETGQRKAFAVQLLAVRPSEN
jgi:hypothetical protein